MNKRGVRYASLYERLVANTVEDDNGCWLWTGQTHRGYPKFTRRLEGRKHPVPCYAHRAILEETLGYYFPFDQAGHYKCHNTLCINPDHLRIETLAENLSTRRGYSPCKGSWIPVLYPTPARLAQEALDASTDLLDLSTLMSPIDDNSCPF